MNIGVRRSPEWDIRPPLAYFDKECLQPYGYPDLDKVREVLMSVAPKRPGVNVYQQILADLKSICGR